MINNKMKHERKKQMTLSDWIEKTGPKKVAQLMNVDPSTVSSWKIGANRIPPIRMYQIHQLSKGKVSYKTMVELSLKVKK